MVPALIDRTSLRSMTTDGSSSAIARARVEISTFLEARLWSPPSQTTEWLAPGAGGNREQVERRDANDLVGMTTSRQGTATLRYQGLEHRTRVNRRLST